MCRVEERAEKQREGKEKAVSTRLAVRKETGPNNRGVLTENNESRPSSSEVAWLAAL